MEDQLCAVDFEGHSMKRNHLFLFVVLAMLFGMMSAAQAQGLSGCTDSPENPTAVLAPVGGLGGAFAKLRRRR
jgi:XrtJ-associated TM-motif-TM protein